VVCAEIWETRLYKTRMWRSLTGGDFRRPHYAAFLRETYHYTRRSALIQASTLAHFQVKRRALVRPFLRHALDEESHYLLCAEDLKALGYGTLVESTNPLPTTEGYLGFIFSRIAFVEPIAYVGYLYHLEALAAEVGPVAVKAFAAASDIGKGALRFLTVHAHEDPDHVKDLEAVLAKADVTAADEDEIVYAARTAGALYATMVEAAHDHPWNLA
jgi:hypothetical protein